MQILDNSLRDQIGETFVSQKQFSEQLRKSEYKERLQTLRRFEAVSYTHLTLPTNREV